MKDYEQDELYQLLLTLRENRNVSDIAVTTQLYNGLHGAGINTVEELKNSCPEELYRKRNIGPGSVKRLVEAGFIQPYSEEQIDMKKVQENPDDLYIALDKAGFDPNQISKLYRKFKRNGIKTVSDLAEQDSISIQRIDGIGDKAISRLLMSGLIKPSNDIVLDIKGLPEKTLEQLQAIQKITGKAFMEIMIELIEKEFTELGGN